MPEFKRNFTAGKMNKDLNERLVPKGEYRHAMNVQVSTSENSDVGTVQNILGNEKINNQAIMPVSSVCIGTIADEKNDALYWFTTQESWPSQPFSKNSLEFDSPQGINNAKKDIIWEHKDNTITPVFCATGLISYVAFHSSGNHIEWDTSNFKVKFPFSVDNSLLVDMDVEIMAYNASGTTEVFDGFTITNVTGGDITLSGDISFLDNSTTDTQLKNTKFFFSTASEFNTSLNFDSNKIITGINVIDDMLFWTDGYDEPKKINISRSIEGTKIAATGIVMPTKLLNPARDITALSDIACKKEHITVIRRAPLRPPTLNMSTKKRQNLDPEVDFLATTNPTFAGRLVGDEIWVKVMAISGVHPDLRVGDYLKLLDDASFVAGGSIADDYLVRASVTQKIQGPYNPSATSFSGGPGPLPSNHTAYCLKIQSLSNITASAIDTAYSWIGSLEGEEVLFERKFPRFAYRYKYIDNEYSSFSPFSSVAFLPDQFGYQPIKAYNTAMLNKLKSLIVEDFVPTDMPLDVVQVDILYKNETSPTVYLLDSITPKDQIPIDKTTNPWNSFGSSTGDNADMGALEISTESIYAALPTNQTLRSWDNVPKTAVAQEISSNRIIYANYTQGYDMRLLENSIDTLKPNIITFLNNKPISDYNANTSVKSLRSYDIGVVWGDKYGRETPVIASSQGSTVVTKNEAVNSNYFSVELDDSPYWAEYYKFYIKETSNEYYNLPVDRVYDAEDGNIWVSFPSVDRNKVQEDTYLILKKGIDSNLLVKQEARYKIVAIENEAPEYIKTTYELLVETNTDASRPVNSCELWGGTYDAIALTCTLTGGTRSPEPGYKYFTIGSDAWSGTYSTASANMGLPMLNKLFDEVTENSVTDEVFVQFSRVPDTGNPQYSQRYHVSSVEVFTSDDPFYTIHLDQVIFGSGGNPDFDDSFVTNNIANGNDNIHVHFYKKSITNKPEFDGRFFVKILKDDIAMDNLVLPGEPTIVNNTIQKATLNLFKIEETGSGTLDQTASTFRYSSGATNTSEPSGCTTCSKDDWETLLKFGVSTVTSQWFIDKATFASRQMGSPDSNGKIDHVSVETQLTSAGLDSTIPSSHPVTQSCDITSSQSSSTSHTCGGCDWFFNDPYSYYPHTHDGDGKSNGAIGMKGVWEDGGSKYIDLAYSSFGPSDSQSETTNSKVNWAIGDSLNPATVSEEQVVGSLKQGQRFRYTNNTSIVYKILSVVKYRLYNYQGKRTIPASEASYSPTFSYGWTTCGCSTGWDYVFLQMNKDMHLSTNRRFTYRIKYEIDMDLSDAGTLSTASFSDDSLYGNISNTVNEGIDFIDKYVTEEDKEISSNPAIFETEPKEGTDLDIYYEASSSIPVFPVTNKNKYSYIPVGSTILPNPSVAGTTSIDLSTVFITGWANISTDSNSSTIYLSAPTPALDIILLLQEGDMNILKDNGEIVTVGVVGGEVDASGNVIQLDIVPKKRFGLNWFNCWSFNNGVESNRIGDTFNNPFISNGVAASTTIDTQYTEEHRKYGLIYSGIYNSTSGVNELNQFIAAEKITKDINPAYGSIQKLKSGWGQGGDLVTLCEDRVLKILANKDALFNADGNTNLTSTNKVLGQAIPYSGEYGISTNPESFASEAYRAYFTDKIRGVVMRLSIDGLTPISDQGMSDWFKDNLKINNKAVGSYDDKKREYNLTLSNVINFEARALGNSKNASQPCGQFDAGDTILLTAVNANKINVGDILSGIGIPSGTSVVSKTFMGGGFGASVSLTGFNWKIELSVAMNGGAMGTTFYYGPPGGCDVYWKTTVYIEQDGDTTVSYKERVKGWVSFKSFIPEQARSVANDYYTFKEGEIWMHHSETGFRNTFYDDFSNSVIEAIVNDVPGSVKSFKAVSYEGSQAKVTVPENDGLMFNDGEYFNLEEEKGWHVTSSYTNLEQGSVAEFVNKEGKWFAYIIGNETSINNDGIINNNYNTSDFSVQGIGNLISTEINTITGCTDEDAFNFSPAASIPCNDGAPNDCCIEVVLGCIDSSASNFDLLANTDDGSCIILGCTSEYGPSGVLNNNYNSSANVDDGSCEEYIPGCTDSTMFNFSSTATIACGGDTPIPGDGYGQAVNYCCEPIAEGCIDPNADQVTPGANTNNDTCTYTGCTNPLASNYSFNGSNPQVDGTTGNQANLLYQNGYAVDNGLCVTTINPAELLGCTDPLANNFDSSANVDDGLCEYCSGLASITPIPTAVVGSSNYSPNYFVPLNNYFEASIVNDETYPGANDGHINVTIVSTSPLGSDSTPILIDSAGNTVFASISVGQTYMFNNISSGQYDLTITQHSSAFIGDQTAPCVLSYENLLEVLPGTEVLGCTDNTACNYNPLATPGNLDAANCDYTSCVGCMDSNATNYDPSATMPSICTYAVSGCTDPAADNYDATATVDDGSCNYAVLLDPNSLMVGDAYKGGIIGQIFPSTHPLYVAGEVHGIIVATVDASASAYWSLGCYSTSIATSEDSGQGQNNTNEIINAPCNLTSLSTAHAAAIAYNYTDGVYTDWFLPSHHELKRIAQLTGPGASGTNSNGDSNDNISNFVQNGTYWSSSESTIAKAFVRVIPSPVTSANRLKTDNWRVRAVRYF